MSNDTASTEPITNTPEEETPEIQDAEIITDSNEVEGQDWFDKMIEECKAIIVEHEFNSRWALVEGYHALGTRILAENDNFERSKIYGENIVARVRESIGKSKATIWRAIQFAKKYPDLEALPEGKNTSWGQICKKYLPEPKEEGAEEPTKKKVEFDAIVDKSPSVDIPEPEVKMAYNIQTELWEITITKSDLKNVDIQYLQKQLEDFIHST